MINRVQPHSRANLTQGIPARHLLSTTSCSALPAYHLGQSIVTARSIELNP